MATPVEASAVAALYAFIAQSFVHKDISVKRDLMRVLKDCALMIGGVRAAAR